VRPCSEAREARIRAALGLFGVAPHAGEVHLHAGLVPNDPGVVAWWDHDDVARAVASRAILPAVTPFFT
jgi:hypothetical protein